MDEPDGVPGHVPAGTLGRCLSMIRPHARRARRSISGLLDLECDPEVLQESVLDLVAKVKVR
jgi:hypothetical protein